mmetsp:Transcript_32065/g.76209  ORF Transcript_32065/g.76209 Transcript_32065/m.76209 type:complete len:200 (-) Transcript_32065:926-1525(-)
MHSAVATVTIVVLDYLCLHKVNSLKRVHHLSKGYLHSCRCSWRAVLLSLYSPLPRGTPWVFACVRSLRFLWKALETELCVFTHIVPGKLWVQLEAPAFCGKQNRFSCLNFAFNSQRSLNKCVSFCQPDLELTARLALECRPGTELAVCWSAAGEDSYAAKSSMQPIPCLALCDCCLCTSSLACSKAGSRMPVWFPPDFL